MYSVRLLNQEKTLLAVLPTTGWSYNRKISEATEITVSIPRESIKTVPMSNELFTYLSPFQVTETDEEVSNSLASTTPALAYFLQIYKDTDMIGMGIIAKRDFTENLINFKAHTEEHLMSLYRTPADYGIKYDNTDICDVARDMLSGWAIQRIKGNWDEAQDESQVDYTTDPAMVYLDKDGSGTYYARGYITFRFSQPDDFLKWERIRWSADNEAPVYTTMAYRTYDGSWSSWSTEYEGALPDKIGIEIADIDATMIEVRITLETDDQTSEDDSGDPVGSTPALFAIEVISRTTAYLLSSIPASSTAEVYGIQADEKSPLQVLQDACEQVGWEFRVFNGVLYLAESIGDSLELLFRSGTNMDISQLGDDAAEIVNFVIAKGTGSGINRPLVTVKDSESIATYGMRQEVKEFDESDPDDLLTAATAYLATVSEPFFSWKVKTKFPFTAMPAFTSGDTVTVADPKSGTVQRSRIMEHRLSLGNNELTSECYLGKTRANLVPARTPIYRETSLTAPKSVAITAADKGLIIIVPKPLNSSLWAYTELYMNTSTSVTAIAENLKAKQRSTLFNIQGLLPKTTYYVRARYVDVYGAATSLSTETSLDTLKFSTPFEDMQPGDSDPDTLAFQTEGGKVKIFNNGTIEAVDGNFSGVLNSAGGIFNGYIQTPAITSEPGDVTEDVENFTDQTDIAKDIYDYYLALGKPTATLFRADVDTVVDSYFMRIEYTDEGSVKTYSVRVYDSGASQLDYVLYICIALTGWFKAGGIGSPEITTYTGGDKLKLSSDIPTSDSGLDNYQVWLDGAFLKVKLP